MSTPRPIDRRTAVAGLAAMAATGTLPAPRRARLRKVATEEAFTIPEVASALATVARAGGANLDLPLLAQIYASPPRAASATVDPRNRDALVGAILPRLLDLDAGRLAEMDAHGVDVHLLSLSSPGVQMFAPAEATALARLSNDRLAEAIARHPTRYAGLAAFAPQDPAAAAKEMERAIRTLKLSGFLVNSHTGNGYLDEERFWPILEAAEALDAPLYIHPRAPSDGMAGPFRDYRAEGPVWGYAVEAGTHAMRLMLGGTLDRFPRLKIVLGHMGEALPFWMTRLDFMAQPGGRAGRKNRLKPSEYFARNFYITTSGVEDPLALRLAIDRLGVDRVMWAIDHPFQPTAGAVRFIETATLTDDEREKVAHANAERVFRIPT